MKTTVYAVRDTRNGQRLSYRYRSKRDALELCASLGAMLARQGDTNAPEALEVYRTTQDLPPSREHMNR